MNSFCSCLQPLPPALSVTATCAVVSRLNSGFHGSGHSKLESTKGSSVHLVYWELCWDLELRDVDLSTVSDQWDLVTWLPFLSPVFLWIKGPYILAHPLWYMYLIARPSYWSGAVWVRLSSQINGTDLPKAISDTPCADTVSIHEAHIVPNLQRSRWLLI